MSEYDVYPDLNGHPAETRVTWFEIALHGEMLAVAERLGGEVSGWYYTWDGARLRKTVSVVFTGVPEYGPGEEPQLLRDVRSKLAELTIDGR